MAKQKIVLKVTMEDAKKRSKAMKVAVGFCGSALHTLDFFTFSVMSAQVDGECITVVGDGVDAVALTVMLRKKMCYAELVSVGQAEEKKEEKKDEKKEEKKAEGGDKSSSAQQVIWPCQFPIVPQQIIYETPYNDPCCIL